MLHHRLRAVSSVFQSTKISHVISYTDTITVMSGVRSGDLLVFADVVESEFNSVKPLEIVPSGFTLIMTIVGISSDDMRWSIYYKIANGTESGTVLTGMTGGSDRRRKQLILFRGNKPISSVTIGSLVSQQNIRVPLSTTITSSGGTTPFIIIAFYGSYILTNSSDPNYTFTGETEDETIGYQDNSVVVGAIKYKIKNRGDTSNNIGIGITNTLGEYGLGLIGFYLELE